tara:strand:- start:1220 stop:1405 length:186 start_codon:yes stop_codon:yes gene_type:complete
MKIIKLDSCSPCPYVRRKGEKWSIKYCSAIDPDDIEHDSDRLVNDNISNETFNNHCPLEDG